MSFAAFQGRRLSSLTGLVLLGWSVAATAAAPTAPAAPSAPAAAATAAAAPAEPAPAAATAPASTSTGESWGKAPAGQPSPSAGSTNSTGPSSPWPDATAKPGNASTVPPVYYVEQAPNPDAPPGASAQNAPAPLRNGDVQPMRLHIDEPPPPPARRHLAPRTALWLGARIGFFIPFGDLWGRCSTSGYSACDRIEGSKFSDVAASGPMFELDIGARLGRNYVIYLGWERAQLGGADGPSPDANMAGRQGHAESDYVAVGVRLSADPDDIGLLLDLSIGARRFRGFYAGDTQLQLTDAPMESRLGIGVDIRTNRRFSLSPMLTLGLGSFGKADWVTANTIQSAIPNDSDRLTHGWVTLQLGGHFDLAGGG